MDFENYVYVITGAHITDPLIFVYKREDDAIKSINDIIDHYNLYEKYHNDHVISIGDNPIHLNMFDYFDSYTYTVQKILVK